MAGLQGRAFGGYQLVEQLPAGGIADVYRGRPGRSGGRDVVVKVVYPEFARQPGFLPRFRSIVQQSGKLASHPHVLPLLAHGEDAGYLYLVTPYVEAGTLRDWQLQGGRMGLADAGPFFRQLCDALSYAHSLGVVHGNLKPSNIFLFEGRHVLLGDFGMLWDVGHMDMNHAGSGADAVEYLAPEVLGGQITQLSDIYSLGAVLFSSVAGHAPFHGGKPADVFAAHARLPVPSLAHVSPPLAALDSVIQRTMAKRPEDRFPSAAAAAQAIDLTARQALAAVPPAMPAPAPTFGAASAAPGYAPFVSSEPQVFAPQPPAFGSAPIAPAFGGMTAGMAAGMHAGLGGMPADQASAGLAHLDPPFPPLPVSARVEEQMEQGRVHPPDIGTSTQATVRMPAPTDLGAASGSAPLQPTLRVPAPGGPGPGAPAPGSPGTHSGLTGLLESSPELRAILPAAPQPSDRRPYRISGAPAARLGGLATPAGPAPTSPFDHDDDDGERPVGHQMIPAIRPGAAGEGSAAGGVPAMPGFAVAGGGSGGSGGIAGTSGEPRDDASFTIDAYSASRDGWTGEQSAFGSGDSREWGVYSGEHAQQPDADREYGGNPHHAGDWDAAFSGSGQHGASGWDEGFASEQSGFGVAHGRDNHDDYSEQMRAHAPESFQSGTFSGDSADRPFSPTQLGLPRLTSPVMTDQPPSFHDILSESGITPRFDAGVAVGAHTPTWSDAGESMWGGGTADDGWAASSAGAWDTSARSAAQAMNSAPAAANAWDQNGSVGDFAPEGARGRNARKGRRPEAEEDSGFDDERVWTVGTTAVRAGRRRWVRKLALVMAMVLLVDMVAVIVARPDLCPNAGCKQVSAYLHQKVAFLHIAPAVAAAPLVAVPAVLSLKATAGKSTTIPFILTNTGKADLTWRVSAALPWLSLDHASGTLGAGAHQPLTVTAKPIGVKPGSYTSTLTITTSKGTLAVPITVAVAAAALFGVSPSSLTFNTCGSAQAVTLTNASAATLTFTAVPSQTSALSLDTTSGSLGPGQSSAINVTLLCGAATGNEYTVNVISNGGSAVVTIHYS